MLKFKREGERIKKKRKNERKSAIKFCSQYVSLQFVASSVYSQCNCSV